MLFRQSDIAVVVTILAVRPLALMPYFGNQVPSRMIMSRTNECHINWLSMRPSVCPLVLALKLGLATPSGNLNVITPSAAKYAPRRPSDPRQRRKSARQFLSPGLAPYLVHR